MSCWYTLQTTLGTTKTQLPAAGLHRYGSDETFMLGKFLDESGPLEVITLGRDKECEIHITGDRSISGRHAIIERRGGPIWHITDQSTNGLLINGEPVKGPTMLTLGMEIRIGRETKLFTCDHHRLVPMGMPISIDEMCYLASKMFGGYAEAGRRYELGREFIRTHALNWTAQMMGERP